MASLKEVKRRINSVRGTMKVTSAMGSIAAAKLHKTQGTIEHLLPYQNEMHRIVDILLDCSNSRSTVAVYSAHRPVHKVAIVLVSSNKSFCGAFNSNVFKLLSQVLAEYEQQGLKREDIIIFGVGDKGADAAKRAGFNVVSKHSHLSDKHEWEETASFARELIRMFRSGEVDKVDVIYSHFKSSVSQIPVRETYLPFKLQTGKAEEEEEEDLDAEVTENGSFKEEEIAALTGTEDGQLTDFKTETGHSDDYRYDDYIIDPDAEYILMNTIPRVLVLKVYAILLDAATAENAARTMAMQQASDNGEKLLQDLNLLYNKQRQQAITNELLDIASGSAN